MDFEATVIKSDTVVPSDLHAALIKHAHVLEDVPEHQKDWCVVPQSPIMLYRVVFQILANKQAGTQALMTKF